MNACILFILLNGSAWATPGCWQGGYMIQPQDVVYTQRLPQLYTTQVWVPPPIWVDHWRPWARSFRNWDGYRFSRQQHRRWIRHKRWITNQRPRRVYPHPIRDRRWRERRWQNRKQRMRDRRWQKRKRRQQRRERRRNRR